MELDARTTPLGFRSFFLARNHGLNIHGKDARRRVINKRIYPDRESFVRELIFRGMVAFLDAKLRVFVDRTVSAYEEIVGSRTPREGRRPDVPGAAWNDEFQRDWIRPGDM